MLAPDFLAMDTFMPRLLRCAFWVGCVAPLVGLVVACESTADSPSPATTGGVAGTGGISGVSGSGGSSGGATTAGTAAGGSQAGMTSGGVSGTAGVSGGGAGGAGGASGNAGNGGASGNAGSGGSAGSGACTPGPGPGAGNTFPTTGWKAMWSVPCDFTTNGGCDGVKPPEKAFDGKGDTRSSIGDTHIKAGSPTAEVVGDSFTYDMMTCNKIGKLLLFAAAPPNNNGTFDKRDFAGGLRVTVSSDCTTAADGAITGTFGAVVATADEPDPSCKNGCKTPMTITIDPPVAAKCVKLELTKVLALGGGIWWAIDELQSYP